jgi:hypothetical protein
VVAAEAPSKVPTGVRLMGEKVLYGFLFGVGFACAQLLIGLVL